MRTRDELEAIRDRRGDAGRLAALALTALDRYDALLALRAETDRVGQLAVERERIDALCGDATLEAAAWDCVLDRLAREATPDPEPLTLTEALTRSGHALGAGPSGDA